MNTVAAVSTALAVVVALILGVVQVRQQARKRREHLAVEVLQLVQAPAVAEAIQAVLDLPEGVTAKEFARHAKAARVSLLTFDFMLESVGWMVHRRMVDLHDVDDLMGGIIRLSWRKLRNVTDHMRKENPNYAEWLQWLVERMDADPSPGKRQAAYVTNASWAR